MKETRRKMRPISAPRLTDELLDCVLVFRVRLTTATSDADLATNILQPLNALPRSIAPLVNRATLAAKPWIHIESLLEFDDRWLVESLLQLERTPHNHPVQYRWERVVSFAVTRNDVAFLKWWQSKQFPIGSSFNTEQACESGNVSALDWALAASLKLTFTQKSLQLAFARGHALILNWIIRNHKQSHPALAQAIRSADNLALAIAAGHTSVIRWWLSRPFRTIMPIIAEGQVLEDALSTVAPFLPSKQLEPDSSIVALPTLLALLPAKLVKSIFLLSCASGNLESLDASFKQLSLASSATTTTKPVNAPNRNQGMTHLAYLYASAAGHVHVLNWLDKHDFVPITVISPGTAPDSCTESWIAKSWLELASATRAPSTSGSFITLSPTLPPGSRSTLPSTLHPSWAN
ncbi:hypothetical protein BCR44DRAFT_1238448 [Catenaria anguillulae PL171]|uniref:Ankyrin repeat-containing domain protein n=1 Tax=Catenaria anguillulae PL171 TaxID=765915 RepID=A0A1Y2HD04_9FUNG|nr:hypothetical protein BCR44DRAFT_1238448 [Catenaria anguillulae PL171]